VGSENLVFAELLIKFPVFYGTVRFIGWIILGWIFRRWDVGIWTGLGWPRIETGGGRL